jgi:hypothetical protein
LQNLSHLATAQAVATALKPLLQRVTAVSRVRRAALVTGCLVLPLMACGGMAVGKAFMVQLEKTSPGLLELSQLLNQRSMAIRFPRMMQQWPGDRQVAVYIAHHYRQTITNQAAWSGLMALSWIKGEARKFAERSVAEHPTLTAAEVEEADAAVGSRVPKSNPLTGHSQPWVPWLVFAVSLGIYVAAPALIAALLFRGGLILLIAGVTFVRRDGSRASRLQVFWRSIVTWSPLALAAILFAFLYSLSGVLAAACAGVVFLGGLVAVSLTLPNRGLADRLAGTWPVPR